MKSQLNRSFSSVHHLPWLEVNSKPVLSFSFSFSFSYFVAGKVKRGAFAAGRKITRIISFSKKKSPRSGDPQVSYSNPRQGQSWALLSKTTRGPCWLRITCQSARESCVGIKKKKKELMLSPPSHAGYLSLLVNQMWREQWCCVCQGALHFYHDKGDARTSMPSLPLHGCEVVPGLGPKHPFAFRILRNSTEVAALEVKSVMVSMALWWTLWLKRRPGFLFYSPEQQDWNVQRQTT